MGYRKVWLTGDGDCFFHGIALFLRERDGLPVLNDREFRFSSHQVGQIRATIASAGVESLFPGWNLTLLNQFFAGISTMEQLDQALNQLPDVSFTGVVSRAAFERALPPGLRAPWKSHWQYIDIRKKIAAFFMYWYQKTGPATQDWNWYLKALSLGFGDCRSCIWGDVDLNAEGSGQDSGFAAHLVYHVLALNVIPVLDDDDTANDLTLGYLKNRPARDADHYYLVHTGGHFNAACWIDNALDPSINDNAHNTTASLKSAPLRPITSLSRHIDNSHRSSFVLGVGVWNINHLGEVSQPKMVKDPVKSSSQKSQQPLFPASSNTQDQPDKPAPKIILSSDTKNDLKVQAVHGIVERNADWLDVFTLNEVNRADGMALISQLGYEVHVGPHLYSATDAGGDEHEGQHEYYPLVLTNAARQFKIAWKGCFYVNRRGDAIDSYDGDDVQWTKPENVFALARLKYSQNLQTSVYEEIEGEKFRKSRRSNETPKNLTRDFVLQNSDEDDDPAVESDDQSDFNPEEGEDALSDEEIFRPTKSRRTKSRSNSFFQPNVISPKVAEKVSKPEEVIKPLETEPAEGSEKKDSKPDKMIEQTLYANTFNEYRPVVVHTLVIDEGAEGQLQVNIGVIHTTPGGSEFERVHVYQQLAKFFEGVGQTRIDKPVTEGIPVYWIVLGDFYLFAESRVVPDDAKGSAAADRIKELYDKEVEVYQNRRKEVRKEWRQLIALNLQIAVILDCVKRLKTRACTRIAAAAKLDAKSLTKSYTELSEGAQAASKQFADYCMSDPPNVKEKHPTPSFDDLWNLAAEVDRLAKLTLPVEKAQAWIDWWISAVPACFSRAAEELQTISGGGHPYSDSIAALKQVAESAQSVPGASEKLTLISKYIDTFNDVVLSLTKLKPAELPKRKRASSKAAPKEPQGDDPDEYESPVRYFLRNREAAGSRLNRFRTALDFSFEAKLREKFNVLHTIWGTNMHPKATVNKNAVEYTAFRIADFAVCSPEWRSCEIGVFHKSKSGLIRVDDKAVTTTVHWRDLSDHFPIGGRFSLGAKDKRVQAVFIEEHDADFIAARNVMYLHDILDAFYLDQKKNSWIGLAGAWPRTQASKESEPASSSMSSGKQDETESSSSDGSDYAKPFEMRKDVLLQRMNEYAELKSLCEQVHALDVRSPEVFSVLQQLVAECAQKYPLLYARAKAAGGMWKELILDEPKPILAHPSDNLESSAPTVNIPPPEYRPIPQWPNSSSQTGPFTINSTPVSIGSNPNSAFQRYQPPTPTFQFQITPNPNSSSDGSTPSQSSQGFPFASPSSFGSGAPQQDISFDSEDSEDSMAEEAAAVLFSFGNATFGDTVEFVQPINNLTFDGPTFLEEDADGKNMDT